MENLNKDVPSQPQDLVSDPRPETSPDTSDIHSSHTVENGPPFTERYPAAPPTNSVLNSLPARAYLDETVVPTLLEGMQLLISQRPSDPLQYLGEFLIDRSNQQRSEQRQTPLASHASAAPISDEKMY